MTDSIMDMNDQSPGRPWWKSRTVWGLAITAVSVLAPKYRPVAELLPSLINDVGAVAGLILSLYGRIKAAGPITK